jgi:hypothetical protein
LTQRFNVTTSVWNRHCLGAYPTDEQRISFIPSDRPGAQPGDQAIRFDIQNGDWDPVTNLHDRQRCEVMSYQQLREGADTWTRFQAKLGSGFPFDSSWNYDTKWFRWQSLWSLHLGTGGTSGPAGLAIRSDSSTSGHFELVDGSVKDPAAKMGPNLDQNDNWIRWKGPQIQLDHWYDMVIHVISSSSDSIGRMELWIDGAHQVLRDNGYRHTLVGNDYSYPEFGLYRDSTIQGPATAFGDGYRMGLTPQSVGCTPDSVQGVVCASP